MRSLRDDPHSRNPRLSRNDSAARIVWTDYLRASAHLNSRLMESYSAPGTCKRTRQFAGSITTVHVPSFSWPGSGLASPIGLNPARIEKLHPASPRPCISNSPFSPVYTGPHPAWTLVAPVLCRLGGSDDSVCPLPLTRTPASARPSLSTTCPRKAMPFFSVIRTPILLVAPKSEPGDVADQ
jgi:hypothetical protein